MMLFGQYEYDDKTWQGHQAHQDVVEDGMQIWSRGLWRQKDIATDAGYVIPPHGVLYVKVR